MAIICNQINFRFISRANNEMIESYCKRKNLLIIIKKFNYFNIVSFLANMLQNKFSLCNMNHIAKLTEFFIKIEPDISLNLLMTYHILHSFILYLDFPLIRNFIVSLLGLLPNNSSLNMKNQVRLWNYCLVSDFFLDFTTLMLFPSLERFNIEKSKRSPNIFDISLFLVKKELQMDLPLKIDTNDRKIIVFEEYNGFRTDIDRLKGFLNGPKTYLLNPTMRKIGFSSKIKSMELVKTLESDLKLFAKEIKEIQSEEKEEKTLKKNDFLIKKGSIRISEWKKLQSPVKLSIDREKKIANFDTSPKTTVILPSLTPKSGQKFFMKGLSQNHKLTNLNSMSFLPNSKNHLAFNEISDFSNLNSNSGIKSQGKPNFKKMNSRFDKNYLSVDLKYIELDKSNNLYGIKTQSSFGQAQNLQKEISHNNKKTQDLKQHAYITEIIEESKIKICLKELYPKSQYFLRETDADIKGKDVFFGVEKIREFDYYSLYIGEILVIIIENSIENYMNYNLKKKIDYIQKDYGVLLAAIFNNGRIFEAIFEVRWRLI